MAENSRDARVATMLRLSKARTQLVRALMRGFTEEELGQLFDALPVDHTQPMLTLTEAVGSAWAGLHEGRDEQDPEADRG